jgi:hypothetical protein
MRLGEGFSLANTTSRLANACVLECAASWANASAGKQTHQGKLLQK